MATSRFVGFAPSLAWLVDHPEVAVAARQAATGPGEVFADAVLADPTRLVDVHRALVMASLEPRTPAGVTAELIQVFRRLAGLAVNPTETRRALLPVVGSLKGLRDRDEVVPALRASADSITDLPTRERVLELARYVSTELTVTKRGPFGQVVVVPVTPTEPDPVTPDGPVHPKRPPGKGTGEPVAPVVVEGSPAVDLLDQVAAAAAEAASDWAEKAGFSVDEAGESGAVYATKLAIEITYGSDIGEGAVGAGRCLLAEVLSRVGDHLGGLHGHALGWEFGMAACDSPTPHAVQTAIVSWSSAVQGQALNEVDLSPLLADLFCGGFPSCLIADQILER